MPQGGSKHDAGVVALGEDPRDAAVEPVRVAGKCRVDDRVHHQRRRVRHDRLDMRHRDGAVAGGIERQLLQLAAAEQAVGAEQPGQGLARVAVEAQPEFAQHGLGQDRDVAGLVRVAGQRDRGLGALQQGPQRIAGLQVARLDDHPGIGRRIRQQRCQRGCERLGAGPHEDAAPAAEQADRAGLVDQPQRIGRDVVTVDPHQLERVVGVVDRGPGQLPGALAHQPGIGAEDQHHRIAGVGPTQEGLDLVRLLGDHLRCRWRSARRAGSASGRRWSWRCGSGHRARPAATRSAGCCGRSWPTRRPCRRSPPCRSRRSPG